MYVNWRAVLPELQGQGIGTWCMHEIELVAQQEGCQAIRLDAANSFVTSESRRFPL